MRFAFTAVAGKHWLWIFRTAVDTSLYAASAPSMALTLLEIQTKHLPFALKLSTTLAKMRSEYVDMTGRESAGPA